MNERELVQMLIAQLQENARLSQEVYRLTQENITLRYKSGTMDCGELETKAKEDAAQ